MRQLQPSCVEDVGYYKSSCGYCGSEGETSGAHGMWAHQLSVDAYQVRAVLFCFGSDPYEPGSSCVRATRDMHSTSYFSKWNS